MGYHLWLPEEGQEQQDGRLMIRIPDSLFRPSRSDGRLGRVFIYALDMQTIGITAEYCEDWDSLALWRKTWKTQRSGSTWVINLPMRILRFYLLRESGTKLVTSMDDGRIIITITRR